MKREEKKESLINSCKKYNTYHFNRANFMKCIEEAYLFGAQSIGVESIGHKLLKLMEYNIVFYMDDPYTIERGYMTEELKEDERAWVICPVDHDGDIQTIEYNTLDWIDKENT